MNKHLLLGSLLCGCLLGAETRIHEFSFGLGAVVPGSETHLDTQKVINAELQLNEYGAWLTPEIQFLQSLATDFTDYPGDPTDAYRYDGSTFLSRFALNGVHNFDIGTTWWVPFVKTGLGYEIFNDYHYFDNNDGIFLDFGGGLKYYTTDRFAVKIEALYMKKLDGRRDDSFGLVVGFSYAIGKFKDRSQSRADAGYSLTHTPAASPSGAPVQESGYRKDSDLDGVPDIDDRCPDTPGTLRVDIDGCALPPDLSFSFTPKSDTLPRKAEKQLGALADYLKKTGRKVTIVGFSDDAGSKEHNRELSENRARAVSMYLVEKGVPADRIGIEGMGADYPVMKNDTEEGRRMNRRVEVIFR